MGNACQTVTRDIDNFIDSVCNTAEHEAEDLGEIVDTVVDGLEGKCKPVEFPPWDQNVLVRMSYEDMIKTCKVGDCVFLYGRDVVSQGPEMFQDCNVAHVVQIFKIEESDEGSRKVHYIESSITGKFPHIVNGVQVHDDLSLCLEGHQIAWLLRLDEKHEKTLEDSEKELLGWQELQMGKHYSLGDAISSVFDDKEKWPILHKLFYELNKIHGSTDKNYFCSGLVCAAFVHIGVIQTEEKFQWNLCTPKEFLKLNIWKNEVIQFHGYEEEKTKKDVMIGPVDKKGFRMMTPEEWNVMTSKK